MIGNKPSIYNQPSVYNQGGGGAYIGYPLENDVPLDDDVKLDIVQIQDMQWTRHAISYRKGMNVQEYFSGGWPVSPNPPGAVYRSTFPANSGILYQQRAVEECIKPNLKNGWRVPTKSDFLNLAALLGGWGSAYQVRSIDTNGNYKGLATFSDWVSNGYMSDWTVYSNGTTDFYAWCDPTESKIIHFSYNTATIEDSSSLFPASNASRAYSVVLCRNV